MPRPFKCRFIGGFPHISGFKPAGVPGRALVTVELRFDELEAIRLADQEGLYQEQAAEKMGISRATFGRLLEKAHQKIADAIINGKMLVFQGGRVAMPNVRNFACQDCGHVFEVPFGLGRPQQCPVCSSNNICRASEPPPVPPSGMLGPGPGCRGHRYRGGRGQGV